MLSLFLSQKAAEILATVANTVMYATMFAASVYVRVFEHKNSFVSRFGLAVRR